MSNDNYLLICGRNPVREALAANRVKQVFISNGFSDKKLVDDIVSRGIKISTKSNADLTHMCDENHQGIVAYIKRYEYSSLEDILRVAKTMINPIIVVLDGINDPHNLGAIMRTVDIFGAAGIIVKKHNQVSLNQTVAKTSAGAINYVKVAQVNNLSQTLKQLKDEGFWVVSSSGNAKTNFQELTYDFPCVLVIGNEVEGISRLVLDNSDYVVKIPMKGKVNSLNASVATGILLSKISGF